jgi:hypothetical protein
MGFWVREPTLDGSEVLLLSKRAGRTYEGGRGVVGRLFVTSRRLMFEPERLAKGARSWSVTFSDIVGVERTRPKPFSFKTPFDRNNVTRLQVNLASGNTEVFDVRVHNLPEVIGTINAAAEAAAKN